jgi:rubrerythrin
MSGRYKKYDRAKNYKCEKCGIEFKTEGKPLQCPRCHNVIKER